VTDSFGCTMALALSVWARKPHEVIMAVYACWTIVLGAGSGSPNEWTDARSPNPLKVWEVATRRLIRRLSGHTG
jgi:hypothetical protein